jgi:hypothetical protein
MTAPVYRLALAARSGSGLGTPISGLSDVFSAVGVPRDDSALRYTKGINGYGTLEFALPTDHALVTQANFDCGNRELHLYRDEVLVWGGKLWMADVDWPWVRFLGYSWYYDLTRRDVELDYSSTPTAPFDQFKIVHQLLMLSQGVMTAWNTSVPVSDRNLGITEYADYSTTASGRTRALTVCVEERRKISDVIEEMVNARNGFDFEISPAKVLRLYSPRKGSVLGVTFDTADNISDFSYGIDATEVATQVIGVGEVDDCAAASVYITTDATAVTKYGLLHETVSPDDASDNVDLVEKTADEYLHAHKSAPIQPSAQYATALQDLATAPIGYTSYDIGDWVTVSATRGPAGGFGQVSAEFRIVGKEVTVGSSGVETITPELVTYPSA